MWYLVSPLTVTLQILFLPLHLKLSNCCYRDFPHLFNLINFFEFCGWLKRSECTVMPEIGVICSNSVVTGEYLQCVTVNVVNITIASCQSWRPELIAWSSTQHWASLPRTTFSWSSFLFCFFQASFLRSFSESLLVTITFSSFTWNVFISTWKMKKGKIIHHP